MHNPRISKTPFTKWYVKDYHNKYDIEKMFEVYNSYDNNENDKNNDNNDDNPCVNKINKNLKSKLKNYIFEKI
jgi:hypothetical protein